MEPQRHLAIPQPPSRHCHPRQSFSWSRPPNSQYWMVFHSLFLPLSLARTFHFAGALRFPKHTLLSNLCTRPECLHPSPPGEIPPSLKSLGAKFTSFMKPFQTRSRQSVVPFADFPGAHITLDRKSFPGVSFLSLSKELTSSDYFLHIATIAIKLGIN